MHRTEKHVHVHVPLGLVFHGALRVLSLFRRKPKASECFHKRGKNSRGGFRGLGWVASHVRFGEAKQKKNEKGCEHYGRNQDKLSGQVRHCNRYFVALLVFLTVFNSVQHFGNMPHSHPRLKIPGTAPEFCVRHKYGLGK